MHFRLLSDADLKAIDALKQFHGGAAGIDQAIADKRVFETRLKILSEKGYGDMIADARELVKGFAKVALEPGESRQVTVDLDQRAFSFWSELLEIGRAHV